MSRCESVRLELEAHLRGALSGAAEATVREHLEGCAECRRAARRIAPLVRELASDPAGFDPQPFDPDALADRVLARAASGAGRRPSGATRRPRAAPGSPGRGGLWLPAVGLVAVVGVGGLVWHLRAETPPTTNATESSAPPSPTPTVERPPEVRPAPPAPPVEPPPSEPPPIDPAPAPVAPVEGEPIPVAPDEPEDPDGPVVAEGPTPVEPAPRPDTPTPPPAPRNPAPSDHATPQPAAERLTCRLLRTRGGGRVSGGGANGLEAQPGLVMPTGTTLSVERGALELAVLTGDGELTGGQAAGTRLVLPRGARLTVEAEGLRLDSGDCWAESVGELALRIGETRLQLRDADAQLHAGKRDLSAQVWGGEVRLSGLQPQILVAAGQRVDLDAQGRGAPRRGRGDPPAWRAPGPDPAGLLFQESCRALAQRAWQGLVGTPGPESLTATVRSELGGVYVACLGKGEGLTRFAPGARVRFTYRLTEDVPLAFSVTDLRRHRNLTTTVAHPRVGLWTTVELDLQRLAADQGDPLEPGDALDFLAAQAGTPGHTAPLELRDLTIER